MTDGLLLNDRYHLQEVLGSGGMAVVYKAYDRMLERMVAIKVLREKYSRDPAFRERFRQEARAAANLSHPNIVMVHDFGYDEKRLFIVMEFVPGKTLKDLIEEKGVYELYEAIRLVVQVCAGVGYAHRAGLVHCDMKPHNVLVSPDQRVKVTDFGIARALASISPDEKTEIVWGSPQYFAPEQARGLAPAPASDVYGIGVILYQMLTGKLPFQASSSLELARMHRDLTPRSPISINRSIPLPINDIIMKVLAKEPSARYRTADQLGRVLQSFSEKARAREHSAPTQAVPDPSLTQQASARPASPEPVRALVPTAPPAVEAEPVDSIDWVNVMLGLIALVAVGGLIPFWIWVYYSLNTPGF